MNDINKEEEKSIEEASAVEENTSSALFSPEDLEKFSQLQKPPFCGELGQLWLERGDRPAQPPADRVSVSVAQYLRDNSQKGLDYARQELQNALNIAASRSTPAEFRKYLDEIVQRTNDALKASNSGTLVVAMQKSPPYTTWIALEHGTRREGLASIVPPQKVSILDAQSQRTRGDKKH